MFGLPPRPDSSPEIRAEIQDYLKDVTPLVDKLEVEYANWLQIATEDAKVLRLERDPDGQHASVYLWRVSQPATEFVQKEYPRSVRRYYEAFALCLEARGAAADIFRDAATVAPIKDPSGRIAEANRKLAEAEKYVMRAAEARRRLQVRAGEL